MADAVSQVHNLSRTEVDLVNSIKQMLDENTVDITRKFSWGHQYGSKELRSVTDKLKAEISKKRTVVAAAVSRFNRGVKMHKDTMIIALEPSTLTYIPRPAPDVEAAARADNETVKSDTTITLNNGSYVYIDGDPSLSSSNDRDYVDAIVVVLSPGQ